MFSTRLGFFYKNPPVRRDFRKVFLARNGQFSVLSGVTSGSLVVAMCDKTTRWFSLAVTCFALVTIECAASEDWSLPLECGDPFSNGTNGPYDYRNAVERQRSIRSIETHHLNRRVLTLEGGQTGAYIMGDLDYVLRAVPNHHKALSTLMRYAPDRRPQERNFLNTECYFQRAKAFSPGDAVVRLIFGVYLANSDRLADAENEYRKAVELQPDYAEAHYNLGLLYLKTGDIDRALSAARKAYELGYPLPGLRRSLENKGAWQANRSQ